MDGASSEKRHLVAIGMAMAVTILDGFDAMSLSLVAPRLARDLELAPATLGMLFSCQMVGMMIGAAAGGFAGDRFGRLKSLLVFIFLFAAAAFAMPFLDTLGPIAANRFLAGVGLGAATPIAVALAAQQAPAGRSAFAIATIWAGLPACGIFAAIFNYVATPIWDWHAIFVVGGILPLIVALPTYLVFRDTDAERLQHRGSSLGLPALLRRIGVEHALLLAALFLCGYSAMSIVVYWLPSILTMRGSSELLIMIAFIGVNLGSALGSSLMGWGADRWGMRLVLPVAWASAGLCLLGLEIPLLGSGGYVLLAGLGATFTAGSIGLLIVLASKLEPDYASTMIGGMVTIGRLGQVAALALSGAVAGITGNGAGVFFIAGCAALATGAAAWFVVRRADARPSLT